MEDIEESQAQDEMIDQFVINTEAEQRDTLSATLLNIVLAAVVKSASMQEDIINQKWYK